MLKTTQITMEKFTVLQTNQTYMSCLGIHTPNLTERSNRYFKSFVAHWIWIDMILCVIACSWFIIKNKNDIKSLGAAKLAVACIECTGMFVSIGLKMNQIKVFHLKLQKIVDESTRLWIILFFLVFFLP